VRQEYALCVARLAIRAPPGGGSDSHTCVLQVLWLADNYVSSLTGIEQLAELQELNLARNDIGRIGSSLLPSSRLTSLNLADNQISSLQVRLPASIRMLSWRVASWTPPPKPMCG
jgi:hypothetical protein